MVRAVRGYGWGVGCMRGVGWGGGVELAEAASAWLGQGRAAPCPVWRGGNIYAVCT